MTDPATRATAFAALHVPGTPLILYNAWDAGSAQAIARAGAKAIATGSWSVAAAHGVADGEALSLDDVLANIRRIVRAVDLPVTLDFESGYGVTPGEVGAAAARVLETGAIGINFEDQRIGGEGLYSAAEHAARVAGVRKAADAAGVPLFINARTDVFLKTPSKDHADLHVDEALARARAYADAGASGIFVPGLVDTAKIARFCEASPLPVNIMMSPATPAAPVLAKLGVARVSHGPFPYRAMVKELERAARAVFEER